MDTNDFMVRTLEQFREDIQKVEMSANALRDDGKIYRVYFKHFGVFGCGPIVANTKKEAINRFRHLDTGLDILTAEVYTLGDTKDKEEVLENHV